MTDAPVIAMIDDETDFLEIASGILTAKGYITMCTTDPEIFLEYFKHHDINLAILDVEMPGKTGFDLVQELRQGGADLNMPVIFLSGHKAPGEQLQGYFSGANEYLFKPVNRQQLVETVAQLLAGTSSL